MPSGEAAIAADWITAAKMSENGKIQLENVDFQVFFPRGCSGPEAVIKSAAGAASPEGFQAVIQSAASAASLAAQKIVKKLWKNCLFGPFI